MNHSDEKTIKMIWAIQITLSVVLGGLGTFYGLYMCWKGMTLGTGQSGDLSGLFLVFGVPILVIGFIFLCGLFSAIKLYKLDPKGRRPAIVFFIIYILLSPALLFIQPLFIHIPFWCLISLAIFVAIFSSVALVILMRPQVRTWALKTSKNEGTN